MSVCYFVCMAQLQPWLLHLPRPLPSLLLRCGYLCVVLCAVVFSNQLHVRLGPCLLDRSLTFCTLLMQALIAGGSSEYCANAMSAAGAKSWLLDVSPNGNHSLVEEALSFPRIVSARQAAQFSTCRAVLCFRVMLLQKLMLYDQSCCAKEGS